jgi:hypothetical protein
LYYSLRLQNSVLAGKAYSIAFVLSIIAALEPRAALACATLSSLTQVANVLHLPVSSSALPSSPLTHIRIFGFSTSPVRHLPEPKDFFGLFWSTIFDLLGVHK